MRRISLKSRYVIGIMLLALMASSASTHAASVSLKASFFHDALELAVSGTGSSSAFIDPQSSVGAWVDGIYDSDAATSLFSPLVAAVHQPRASSSAVISLDMSSTVDLLRSHGSLYAYASQNGSLTLSGTGILVVTAPFLIEREVIDEGFAEWYGHAVVSIAARRVESGGNIGYSSEGTMFAEDGGPDTLSGLLAIAVPFNDGETIEFSATTLVSLSAQSAVPLPTALPLLVTAIALLGRRGRRHEDGH